MEVCFGDERLIRGLTSDGMQLWATTVGGANEFVVKVVPDALGGILALTQSTNSPGMALIKLDGTTGKQLWNQSSFRIDPNFAVHPDGTIFIVGHWRKRIWPGCLSWND
jgi:hypothetical protein